MHHDPASTGGWSVTPDPTTRRTSPRPGQRQAEPSPRRDWRVRIAAEDRHGNARLLSTCTISDPVAARRWTEDVLMLHADLGEDLGDGLILTARILDPDGWLIGRAQLCGPEDDVSWDLTPDNPVPAESGRPRPTMPPIPGPDRRGGLRGTADSHPSRANRGMRRLGRR